MRSKGSGVVLRWAIALAALGVEACTYDFDGPMLLSGYRVVGIEASPPEVTPDDTVTLRVHDYYEGHEAMHYRWRLCLNSWGAADDYRCQDDVLDISEELAISDDASEVVLDLGPTGLNLRERLDELGKVTGPDGEARSLKQGFEVWFQLRSGPDSSSRCSDCEPIVTQKRLRVRDDSSQSPNQNPVIDEFSITGTKRRGGTLRLKVNTDSPETYRDPDSGERLQEEYLYSWYTSAGTTEPSRSFGSTKQSELQLPNRAQSLEVLVTVRDGRGGLAVSRQSLNIE